MTDIVERLRGGVYGINRIPLCSEAADEIERLREHAVILAETAREVERERCAKMCDKARAAVWHYHDAEAFKVAQTVCENLANRIRGLGA